MKVWVVISDYFNGEGSANGLGGVYSSESKAKEFCARMNAARTSGYSTSYDYEERTLDEDCA